MSLDRIMLILVVLFGGLAAIAWLGTFIFAVGQVNPLLGLVGLAIAGFVIYIAWRVVAERLGNPEDDKYDRMEK
ncbi:MAG: hypothetical protein AAGH82_00930 [Pseudomonadota bacterium]